MEGMLKTKSYQSPLPPFIEAMQQSTKTAFGTIRGVIKGTAETLNKAQTEGIPAIGGDVPKFTGTEDMLKAMLAPVGKYPDLKPFGLPPKASGRMSEYFNPAAYRDEVMTRELNAAEQTAQNTSDILGEMSTIRDVVSRMTNPIGSLNDLQIRALTVA